MTITKRLPIIVSAVFEMLNTKHYAYAVLRNFEGLPYANKSRDIDILVKKKDYKSLKKDITDCIIRNCYLIINYFESERLRTFICGKIEQGHVELVQFDFFVHTSAYGHIILTADEILQSRICTNGIYHVSKEYEFLDKYLYLKYIGAKYPAKYNGLKEQMLLNDTLNAVLEKDFGIPSFAELDKMSCSRFRTIANKKGNFGNIVSFWRYYLQNYFSYKGFSIGFTGPDGSGKTTVINELLNQLQTVFSQIELYHFRPMIIGNLGEVAHSAGLKKDVDREYDKPHRGGRTGVISSFLRLCYYSVDYIIGYQKSVRPFLAKRGVVVFDRYYTDIICDSRRSRIYLNTKFLYWFGKWFIPSLDYNILLTASTKTILSRKQELDKKGIQDINNKIAYLAGKNSYYKIMNEGTPLDAVQAIMKMIFEKRHEKNIKRLR